MRRVRGWVRQRPLRAAEVVAHAASIVAVLLTLVMVGASQASEANPGSALIIEGIGLHGWALLTPVGVAAIFAVLRAVRRRWDDPSHRIRVHHLGGYVAGALLLDSVGNVVGLAYLGLPESYPWMRLAQTAGGLLVLATVMVARPQIRTVAAAANRRRVRQAAAVVGCLFLVVAGTPPALFGSGAPFGAVGSASATGSVIDDFEDGLITDNWTIQRDNPHASQAEAVEGSWSLEFDPLNDGGQPQAFRDLTTSTPDQVSVWARAGFGNTSGDASWTLGSDGGDDIQFTFNFNDNQNIGLEHLSNGVYCSNITNTQPGEWVKLTLKNIDYSSDSFVAEVQDESGNVLGTCNPTVADDLTGLDTISGGAFEGTLYLDYFTKNGATIGPPLSDLSGGVNDLDGDPVQGVTVYAFNSSTGSLENSTTTDVSGVFTMGVPNGTYDLTAEKSGFVNTTKTETINGDTQVNFVIGREFWINGTVNDTDGNLIQGATVSVGSFSTTTDASGVYNLSVTNGTYDVSASATGHSTATFTDLTVDGQNTVLDFTLGSDLPYLTAASPRNGAYQQSSRSITLSATPATDSGDDINVTFYTWDGSSFTQEGSQQTVANDTAATQSYSARKGLNQWKVELTANQTSRTRNSSIFQFYTPGDITIYNGSDLTQLTGHNVDVTVQSTESGYRDESTVSTGVYDLLGTPREEILVQFESTNFVTKTINIDDPAKEYFTVLYPASGSGLPNASDTYNQSFTLSDETGDFHPTETRLVILAHFNGDWRYLSAERFGGANNATMSLQDGTNYRLEAHNDDGNIRSLGEFVGDKSLSDTTVELTIDDRSIDQRDLEDTDAFRWAAWFEDDTNQIKFSWATKNNSTADNFRLFIYERGDRTNRSTFNFGDAVASVDHTQPLSNTEANLTWVVEWEADYNNASVGGKTVLGGRGFLGVGLSDFWKNFFAIGLIIVVAGLFGGLRAELGAIVVPLVAGILWWMQWLPGSISGGIILLALVVAIMWRAGTARGGPV